MLVCKESNLIRFIHNTKSYLCKANHHLSSIWIKSDSDLSELNGCSICQRAHGLVILYCFILAVHFIKFFTISINFAAKIEG